MKLRQDAFEIAPVQHIELGKRLPAGAHFLHAGLVLGPPGVGKGQPVELGSNRTEDKFGLPGDR
jgi:hypothetical protein